MKRLSPFVRSHIRLFFLTCCFFLFAGATVIDAKIVFCIEGDIYVMDDNGTNKRRLTKNTVSKDLYPRWSPDGKRITFIRKMDRNQTSSELFIMNADGTNVQRLTDNNVGDAYPSWSPDGKKIAFRSRLSGGSEVHVIDLATLHITQLTEGEKGSTAPDWSPDGTQIVYEKFIRTPPVIGEGALGFIHKNIYLMLANGENQRPLIPDPEPGVNISVMRFFPRWSADGQRIVFADCTWMDDEQRCRLAVATLHGKIQQIKGIYDKLGDDLLAGYACWMHNDKALLFEVKRLDKPKLNYDLYRYEFNTQSLKRLTRGEEDEEYADWVEGTLSVTPQGKLSTQWGEKKQTD